MRTISTILALVLFGPVAAGADKPAIDPAVAAAWGFTATPSVVVQPPSKPEAMPSYRVYQDANGTWWQVPVNNPAPEVRANPFRPAPSTTPRTVAQVAEGLSIESPGTTVTGLTPTYAVPAGQLGNTSGCVTGYG